MIPLAVKLQKAGNNIFVGGGIELLAFFKQEMKGITDISFPGFNPRYSAHLPQYIAIILRIPLLVYHVLTEHFRIKKIISDNDIDIVISDNRFGLWNRSIKSVYVTHQLLIPFPGPLRSLEWMGVLFHRSIIRKYDYCFVPDLPGDLNLTGRLSHHVKLLPNVRYIGILSRFTKGISGSNKAGKDAPYYAVILSGPEPQRSIFRSKLITLLKDNGLRTVILEGRPSGTSRHEESLDIVSCDHLISMEMEKLLTECGNIITRAGYSTIMELISIDRSALLVPTPGQTEQEYLAASLSSKGWFTSVRQKDLSGIGNIPGSIGPGAQEIITESRKLLEKALAELLYQPDR
jgi:hypothetical protein